MILAGSTCDSQNDRLWNLQEGRATRRLPTPDMRPQERE
jgi:hypothetical protein